MYDEYEFDYDRIVEDTDALYEDDYFDDGDDYPVQFVNGVASGVTTSLTSPLKWKVFSGTLNGTGSGNARYTFVSTATPSDFTDALGCTVASETTAGNQWRFFANYDVEGQSFIYVEVCDVAGGNLIFTVRHGTDHDGKTARFVLFYR